MLVSNIVLKQTCLLYYEHHYLNPWLLLNLLTWTCGLIVLYVLRLKVSFVRSNTIKSLLFRASLIILAMVEWLIILRQDGGVTNNSLPRWRSDFKSPLFGAALIYYVLCALIVNYIDHMYLTIKRTTLYAMGCEHTGCKSCMTEAWNWVDLQCLCFVYYS